MVRDGAERLDSSAGGGLALGSPCKARISVFGLLLNGCPSDIAWLVMPHGVYAVQRHAFRAGPELIQKLIIGIKSKLHIGVCVVMICLDAALGFVE